MATTKRTRPTSRRPAAAKAAATKAKPRTPRAAGKSSVIPSAHTLGISAMVVGFGAVVAGAFAWLRSRAPMEGHAAPDLAPGATEEPTPAAFRPDMDAPMTAAEKAALRPPTLDA